MAPKAPIRGALMTYFKKHPGETVYLAEIQEALGETDPRRVQSGILNAIREEAAPIENVTRGQSWIYRPNGVPAPRKNQDLFVHIGTSAKDGSLILESESGALYRATEI